MIQTSRFITIGLVISAVLFTALPGTAYAIGFPVFGGMIIEIRPCFGSSLVVTTIAQPLPLPPIKVAALPSPFLFFMMSHPGQFVLGLLGAPAFCATSPDSGFSAPSSFFYGTSI